METQDWHPAAAMSWCRVLPALQAAYGWVCAMHPSTPLEIYMWNLII